MVTALRELMGIFTFGSAAGIFHLASRGRAESPSWGPEI